MGGHNYVMTLGRTILADDIAYRNIQQKRKACCHLDGNFLGKGLNIFCTLGRLTKGVSPMIREASF